MRAGLYERVSTGIKDADRSRSVEDQNRDNDAAIRRLAWTVAGRYADPGLSASRFAKKARPEWDRLLGDIRAGRLDVVVMWASTRGSRELEAWAGFLNACRAHGVRIYVTKDDYLYDLSNDRDWRYLASEGIESASESDKISRQSRRGIAAAALRGEPHGRIPYGYTREYKHDPTHPKGKRPIQIPDPVEAPVASEIITRIARNYPIVRLRDDLAERGIMCRDGTPWVHSSITAMARNVVYIGKRRHNGGPLLDGNWPPLVDEEVFWAAQRVLSDPARKIQAETRGGIRPGAAKWLLSYISTCDVCGSRLGMKYRQGVPHYKCSARTATHAYAPVDWMDWLIGEAVVRWCAQERVYAEITAGDDNGALAAQAEADAERDRLTTFEDQAIAGTLSADAYARIATRLEARIADLEAQAVALAVPAELRELVGASRREKDIAERWKEMELTAQRYVIRKISAPTLRPSRGYGLLNPRRVSVNFTIPMQTRDYSIDPLLPLPACVVR